MESREELVSKQKVLNENLANILKKYGIKNVRMTSMGNSIGSGYSMARTIKPLLLRNVSLREILEKADIELDTHHFARAQNNSDEHVLEWVESNIKESDIHKMNLSDYSKEATSLPANGITEEEKKEYYPTEMENDIGLKDAITESDEKLANIVIYNGATGSLLDGATRHGTLGQQLLHGVKRDIDNIESIARIIQINNRSGKSNTQVYLCGAPNFMGLGITTILINNRLKKLADEYANIVYVEPVKAKFRYDNLDGNGKSLDIHYDEDEYIKFNNNIIEAINDNYQTSDSLIKLDRTFYDLNKRIELQDKELVSDSGTRKQIVSDEIRKASETIENGKERAIFLKRIKKYVTERFPYDFVYLGKKEINESIQEEKRKIK